MIKVIRNSIDVKCKCIQILQDNTLLKPKVENEDFDAVPAKWSSTEAKQMMDNDVKKMSKILGKASYEIIKMMMDGR